MCVYGCGVIINYDFLCFFFYSVFVSTSMNLLVCWVLFCMLRLMQWLQYFINKQWLWHYVHASMCMFGARFGAQLSLKNYITPNKCEMIFSLCLSTHSHSLPSTFSCIFVCMFFCWWKKFYRIFLQKSLFDFSTSISKSKRKNEEKRRKIYKSC